MGVELTDKMKKSPEWPFICSLTFVLLYLLFKMKKTLKYLKQGNQKPHKTFNVPPPKHTHIHVPGNSTKPDNINMNLYYEVLDQMRFVPDQVDLEDTYADLYHLDHSEQALSEIQI